MAAQREQRVEELKVTHQNVSTYCTPVHWPHSLFYFIPTARRRAAQVLQSSEGFPGGVHQERVPGGEARAAEETIVITALSGAKRGVLCVANLGDGMFLRPSAAHPNLTICCPDLRLR